MGRASKYPDELRERAVRMVAEVRPQYSSQWAAITAVAGMLGIGTPETLRTWIRRCEVDSGVRPGVTSQMAEENKVLRKEIAELRRANVIFSRRRELWLDQGVCVVDGVFDVPSRVVRS